MSSQGIMSGKKANNNPRLCPVKEHKSIFVERLEPEISFWTSLWVLLRKHHITKCLLSTQHFIFLFIFCLETSKDGSGPTKFWTELSLVSFLVVWVLHTPACPGTQYSPTMYQVEIVNVFWLCHTNGDVVLAAWRAFRAAWLSQHILMSYSGLAFI
jgi:hypothetical protein